MSKDGLEKIPTDLSVDLDKLLEETEEEKIAWASLTKIERQEIIDSMKIEPSNYGLTSEIRELFWKLKDRSVGIDLTTLKLKFYKVPEISEQFLASFDRYLKSEENYMLPDYELTGANGTVIKPIVYQPFVCEFVSSGKVILENDLRRFFKRNDFDVNSTKGIVQTIEDYAKQGMVHPFVGNSCPTFWINTAKDEIVVGTKYKTEFKGDVEDYIDDMEGYAEWGYVCTDLWWYSLVDYEVFKAKSKLTNVQIDKDYTVLELEAGTWKLEHYYGITRHDHQDLPYGKLTKVK